MNAPVSSAFDAEIDPAILAAVPERWQGECRQWFWFLPPEYHDRLNAAIQHDCTYGAERGETGDQIARRMVWSLRAIHRDMPKGSSAWHCIGDFIACDEQILDPHTDRAERPLVLPPTFKSWRDFADFLQRIAAPLAARLDAVPDSDEYSDILCDVAREVDFEFEQAVRTACRGMQRHDIKRLVDIVTDIGENTLEFWASGGQPKPAPTPPQPAISGKPLPDTTNAPKAAEALSSDSGGRIAYRRAADIQARPINWLWPGRIARGKVTMVAGNPGLGKSQVAGANMAAIVTTGGAWPDGSCCERGNAAILSAEDDAEDTIRPRLEAAGADLSRVFILDAVVDGYRADGTEALRGFNLKTDLSRLGDMLEKIGGAALIVIDPITAYLGEADSHKNAEIRALLAPLSDLAAKHGAAVVCVSHLNKSAGGEALMRVTGSLAFVAAARAAFIVTKDPEDDARRLFLPLKNNIGNDQTGLAFRVESAQVESASGLIETSRIAWETGPVTMTANEVMQHAQGDPEERSALDDARLFLQGLLADGPVKAGQIKQDADGAGFNWRTIQRAADRLNIERHKDGMRGGWSWRLPPKMTNTPEDDRPETVSPSGNLVAFGGEINLERIKP